MSSETEMKSGGCGGCLSIVLFLFLIWALLFGVTVGGIHYSISCDGMSGVNIKSD